MVENSTGSGKRQLNYELLRIVAMVMIVILHYLSKGGVLGDSASVDMTPTRYTAWLVEAFCLVCVNVYVLISGYFGLGGTSLEKTFKVWKQVLFYSVAIGVIAMATGLQGFDIYRIFDYIFPIVTEHYWFATAYVFLCILMPFLNAGISGLNKRQLRYVIGIMLILFSVAKTFLPMHLPWDKSGYDVLWFVVLYLSGAYIRKYGLKRLSKKPFAFLNYIISTLVIFLSFVIIRAIYLKTGSLADFISYGYSYNYLFCYLGSISFFMLFGGIDNARLEKARGLIEMLSRATFGVYLIHEHINLRYLWPTWFCTDRAAGFAVPLFLVHMLVTVGVVYLVCSAIELLRQGACRYIKQKFIKDRNA
jgi:hypothetical protein